jgi:hypothetical protein
MSRWGRLAVLLCLIAGGLRTQAAADTLYGVKAPKDAAFVRIFRVGDGSGPLDVGSKRFDPPPGGVTPYRPILPDIYLVRSGGHEIELIPKAKHYYTLALTPEGIRIFEDVEHTDPARAQLVLYNLLPMERVDLKAADGRTAVIAGVGPGEAGRVNVNAVPVKLAVFGSTGPLGMVDDPGLSRGASYSVFVFKSGSVLSVVCAKAELAQK